MKLPCWILLGALCVAAGCTRAPQSPRLDFFDVSPDGQRVVFNWVKDGVSSIEDIELSTGSRRVLFAGQPHVSFYRPAYSTDGRKIAFIRKTVGDQGGHVCIASSDGSDMDTLARDLGIVTEVIVSASGGHVFFLAAAEFTNYSPVARKAPHGFNLFAVELATKNVSQFTWLNAYSLSSLSRWGDDQVVFRLEGGDNSGIYSLSVDRPGRTPEIIPTPAGVEQSRAMFYGAEPSKRWGKIALIAPYRLHVMNADGTGTKLLSADTALGHIGKVRWHPNEDALFYTRKGTTHLYLIDSAGTWHQRLRVLSRSGK